MSSAAYSTKTLFQVDEVICKKLKPNGQVDSYYVKWQYYSSDFNSWVKPKDFVNPSDPNRVDLCDKKLTAAKWAEPLKPSVKAVKDNVLAAIRPARLLAGARKRKAQ